MLKLLPDFDFSSYHYYNGWAFWNNRLGIDILPTSFRSYFNPILDAINYYVITKCEMHPYIFLFITGIKFGIFLFLSYLLYDLIFRGKYKLVLTLFSLLFLFFSPLLIRTLAFDWNDMQVSAFILLALYLIFRNIYNTDSKKSLFMLFLSGGLLGFVVGLKYTAFIFCISVLLCAAASYKRNKHLFKTIFLLLAGMFLGFILSDGYWIYMVYKHFLNPVFPYFNNFFHSPYGVTSAVLDYDFGHLRPNSFYSFLFLPLSNNLLENTSSECSFFDIKFILTFVLVILYIPLRLGSYKFKRYLCRITDIRIVDIIIIFIISSYYINTFVFGQARYLGPVFVLASALIAAFGYIYASFFKDTKVCLGKLVAFAVIIGIVHIFSSKFYALEPLVILLYITAFYYIFKICLSEKVLQFDKVMYSYFLIVTLCILGLTNLQNSNWIYNFDLESTLRFNKVKINKDSVVFCGSMASCFMAPHVYPDAKFVSYALQNDKLKEKFSIAEWRYASLTDYTSPYMQELTKEILNGNQNVYILFAHEDWFFAQDEIRDIYQQSVSEYTDNKINNIFKDCKLLNYTLFSYENPFMEYEICKIK